MVDINYDNFVKQPTFESLDWGDAFVYDDELYMVIEPCRHSNVVDLKTGYDANAIQLSDGSYEFFEPDIIVDPVNICINVRNTV